MPNSRELYFLIDEWFAKQGEYYKGSVIDGNFDLEDLARHILEKYNVLEYIIKEKD